MRGGRLGIILALITALCWGTGDFLARSLTRHIGSYRTLLFVQLTGFIALSCYLLPSGELAHRLSGIVYGVLAWAVAGSLLNLIGSLLLYRAFEIGLLAVVSPIAASYAAVTAALSVLSGEAVRRGQAAGMVATLLGVALAAGLLVRGANGVPTAGAPRRRKVAGPGVALAVLSAIAYGIGFWILGYHVTPQLGGTVPVWIVRLVTIVTLTTVAVPLRRDVHLPRHAGRWGLLAAVGLIDTVGFVAFAHAVQGGHVAIVGVLSSLFSAVTVVLAHFFLHERLAVSQWLGLAGIFAGVALVSG